MDTAVEILGLTAGAVTSMGFIPQLIRGYRTKKLDDVSLYMPLVLAFGMSLWLIYGIFKEGLSIVVANAFGIGCCLTLLAMKHIYRQKTSNS